MSEAISKIRILTREATYEYTDIDLNVSDHIKEYVEGLPHILDRSIIIYISTRRDINTNLFARNITIQNFDEIDRRLNLVGKHYVIRPTIYSNRHGSLGVVLEIAGALHARLSRLEAQM